MVAVSIKMCQILHIQTLQKLKGYIHIYLFSFRLKAHLFFVMKKYGIVRESSATLRLWKQDIVVATSKIRKTFLLKYISGIVAEVTL